MDFFKFGNKEKISETFSLNTHITIVTLKKEIGLIHKEILNHCLETQLLQFFQIKSQN